MVCVTMPTYVATEKEAVYVMCFARQIPNKFGKLMVPASYLKEMVGRDYKNVRECLERKGGMQVERTWSNYSDNPFCMPHALIPSRNFHEVEIRSLAIRKKLRREFGGGDTSGICHKVEQNIDMLSLDHTELKPELTLGWLRGMINSGTFHTPYRGKVIQDDFSGRVHSPVSLLNRGVRKHLLLDGEKTVQVDAHASQAFLCAIRYRDVKAIEMASGGEFWELLITRYPNMTKDQIKEEVYRQIYGGESNILNCVYSTLADNMQKGRVAGRKRCRSMQKTERRIFIDGVFLELCNERIPAIPIHDCILCKVSDREYVTEKVRRCWKAETGFEVHV